MDENQAAPREKEGEEGPSLRSSGSAFLTEPAPERDLAWVFVGPQGQLRAGWSALLFFAIAFGLLRIVGDAVGEWVRGQAGGADGMPVWPGLIGEAVELGLVAAATWMMARIEEKPLLSYGYQGRARGVRLVSGLVWGFVAISALVFTLDKLGYLAIQGPALGGAAAAHYALVWGGVFLLVGFFEESMMRGYLQFTLTRGMGFWWAAILLSVMFGLGHRHNPGETPVGLVAAGTVGLVFCLSLWYTGSLWWAVGFHAAWDWGESYFYGTADSGVVAQGHLLKEHALGPALWSGGTTGPEGSVLVFPLLAVVALLMWMWWGKRGERPFRGMGWRGR